MTNDNRESLPVVERILDLPGLVAKKSHFLLGPRQTGKTFLIRHRLKDAKVYDLLDTATYLRISQNPGRIAQELAPQDRVVVIDEIQRALPSPKRLRAGRRNTLQRAGTDVTRG